MKNLLIKLLEAIGKTPVLIFTIVGMLLTIVLTVTGNYQYGLGLLGLNAIYTLLGLTSNKLVKKLKE